MKKPAHPLTYIKRLSDMKKEAKRPKEEGLGNLGEIEVTCLRNGDMDFGSSCNFCSANKAKILVRGSGLAVRFCQVCLDAVREFA